MDNIMDALFPTHAIREYKDIPVNPRRIPFFAEAELYRAVRQTWCQKALGSSGVERGNHTYLMRILNSFLKDRRLNYTTVATGEQDRNCAGLVPETGPMDNFIES
ncbi:hypothetical protein J6590_017170 [Homalodisca vitripennis]|nr:hypothetical protein J6590_017170 [Homalodisca vitripennis]